MPYQTTSVSSRPRIFGFWRERGKRWASGERIRGFIEELAEEELNDALGRTRYQRPGSPDLTRGSAETGAARTAAGYRHGRRERQLLGSFGPVTISVPRARLDNADGTTREWRSQVLPRYARMTKQVEALIAGAYLSGTNTRRVRRALGALFKGAVIEGHGQPDLAESADRLGGVVPRPRWRKDIVRLIPL